MSSTSTFTPAVRSLFADGIAASEALASRERQEAHDRKKAARKKVSLGGSAAQPRYPDKAVRFTEGGYTKVRTVSVNDPEEIPNLTLAQKADLRRKWDREAAAGVEARIRGAVRTAAEGIAKGHKLTGMDDEGKPFEDAVHERIARAEQDGEVITVAGVRHLVDPFSSLARRGSLHTDKAVNEALHQAGIRYRTTVYTAGLDGSAKAMDLTKDIVDGGEPMSGMAVSERVAQARKAIREATAAVVAAGPNLLPYLDLVVLQDCTIEQARLQLRPGDARSSGRLFVERHLVEALTILAHHWDMMPRSGPRPIQACGADEVRFYEVRRRKIA